MRGIVLAGGTGTRLQPLTIAVSKQLLPVYDKPMIYYPISVLMHAKIRDILLISTARDLPAYRELLGDGSKWGISLSYAVQTKPRGVADAFIIGERFLASGRAALVLGDNIFYGHGLPDLLIDASRSVDPATIFAYRIHDPQRYGVVELDSFGNPQSIEEKPAIPKSHWAVTGLYYYGNDVVEIAKQLKPSKRGELEITDINRTYLHAGKLVVRQLGRGYAWLDTGASDSLLEASEFIRAIQHRQGLKIACLEEIALINKWISKDDVMTIGLSMKASEYGRYLIELAEMAE